jgi:hypothetical protein
MAPDIAITVTLILYLNGSLISAGRNPLWTRGDKTPHLILVTRCTILRGLVCMSARTQQEVIINQWIVPKNPTKIPVQADMRSTRSKGLVKAFFSGKPY